MSDLDDLDPTTAGFMARLTPDKVRDFLNDHLDESDDWFNGLVQGLLLSEALDTYQVERLEDYWFEKRAT